MAGRASLDPTDEAIPQPSQQAAAGSAPRGPPTQPGAPEDSGTSIPSAVAVILRALLGPAAGRLFLRSVEWVLATSQRWLNRCLPLGKRQAADGAAEGPDSADGALRHSGLLPLGSLSGSVGSRAVALVQQLWQKGLDTPLDAMKAVQQGWEEPLCNCQEMWVHSNQAEANPCPHPACPGTQARLPEGRRTPVMPPGQALAVGRLLAQRLRDTMVQLQAQVGQLPALLQQAARRAQRGVADVHGAFGQAVSLRELLGTVVAQGREAVAQAREALVVFLLRHPMAPWLEDGGEAAGTAAPHPTPPHPQT